MSRPQSCRGIALKGGEARSVSLFWGMRPIPSPLGAMVTKRRAADTADTMKQPQTRADQEDSAMPVEDRRTTTRTHSAQWPEAMREEFRKVQFLDAVEVGEIEPSAWRDIFASFEGRHIRFI